MNNKPNLELNKENLLKGPLFDKFTYTHIFVCISIYHFLFKFKIKNPFLIGLIIHTIYEVKDFLNTYVIPYKKKKLFITFFGTPLNNTFLNSIGDTIGCIIGYFIYIYILKKNISDKMALFYFFLGFSIITAHNIAEKEFK